MEAYSHITLSDEELEDSLIAALIKKERKLEQDEINARIVTNRKRFTESQWTVSQTISYMQFRASKIFSKPFVVDNSNLPILDLLSAYYSKDSSFIKLAEGLDVKNPSLEKGILLGGAVGVGKTTIMALFSKNQRQVFDVSNALSIADSFLQGGAEYIFRMSQRRQLPVNDPDNLFQLESGMCIDDLGSEMMKNSYGNKKNVIGELIEQRYAAGNMGIWFHLTTNLTMGQVKEYYGDRVASRLRETMNVIEFKGEDRRK